MHKRILLMIITLQLSVCLCIASKSNNWWNNPDLLYWSEVTCLPHGTFNAGAAFLNGDYYNVCGTSTPFVQKFDGSTWSVSSSDYPGGYDAASGINCCDWNNKIITTPSRYYKYSTIYDPIVDTWIQSTACPTDWHCWGSIVTLNNQCFMFGGLDHETIPSSLSYKWIPGEALMTLVSPLPYPRFGMAISAYNNKIYLFGGQSTGNVITDTIWEYDPSIETYTEKSAKLVKNRYRSFAVTIGDSIYVFSGLYNYWRPALTVDCYHPLTDTITTATPMIQVPRGQAGAGGLLTPTEGVLYGSGGESTNQAYKGSITIIEKTESTSVGRIKTLYR